MLFVYKLDYLRDGCRFNLFNTNEVSYEISPIFEGKPFASKNFEKFAPCPKSSGGQVRHRAISIMRW